MEGKAFLLLNNIILLIGQVSADCDRFPVQLQEGNLGQTGDLSWLGVLQVHMQDGGVTLSDIVLIKVKYALVSADDVERIPKYNFMSDSLAIFILAGGKPWTVAPASYVTHPEYGKTTNNSLAIIELDLAEGQDYPLSPICLPLDDEPVYYKHLYLTGYTNENQILEKVIYGIQKTAKKNCEMFYTGLRSTPHYKPAAYLCGYTPSINTQCNWDNGMALVSNATGYFYLVGLGAHGPGCAAPARFLRLFHYFPWIDSVICPEQVYDTDECRRLDDDIENVPIEELTVDGRRQMDGETNDDGGESGLMKHHIIERSQNDTFISIAAFNGTSKKHDKACTSKMALVHTKNFELKATVIRGVVTYKLSLHKLADGVRSCVRLSVYCDDRSSAVLSFKEGAPPRSTASKLLNYDTNLDDQIFGKVNDYDLFVTVHFTNRAVLKFELFEEPSLSRPRAPWKPFPTRKKYKPIWGTHFWGSDLWE